MCGIAGFVSWNKPLDEGSRRLLARMTEVITHRGPDDEGFHIDTRAALGFRRLAIIDVGGGHQPLSNEDGTVWIVFNGEIYNYVELREWLLTRGHQFRTRSDTETIVHLYEELHTACVDKLRGMFAFAIWDARRRELFLARDRVGKKPLYYASTPERFWFASETKSILQDPSVDMEVDPQAIDAYMTFSYVPAPMTGFKRIRKLPGGHWLRVTRTHLEEREYWDWHFDDTDQPHRPPLAEVAEQALAAKLRSLLEDSVRGRLMSEVPLGAFLSGGVDSSTIVALMAQLMRDPVRTTSIGFDHQRYNELPYAQEVAKQFRTEHLAHIVQPEAVDILRKIVWHLDEPFGDLSAIPTYFLAQRTRQRVTVALSGDGGDEVFAGYDFRYIPTQAEIRLRRLLPRPLLSPLLSSLATAYPQWSRLPHPLRLKSILRNLSVSADLAHAYDISFIAPELRQSLYRPEFVSQLAGFVPEELVLCLFRKTTARHWLNRALYVDAKFYMQNDVLTKVDRMSMANSLEVRCPLLDQEVMDFAAAVPPNLKLNGSRCKHILREAMKDCLPASAVNRPKQGFSIPQSAWLRDGSREFASDLLLQPDTFISTFVRPDLIHKLWSTHQRGNDYGTALWMLLMLELWGSGYLRSVRGPAQQHTHAHLQAGQGSCA